MKLLDALTAKIARVQDISWPEQTYLKFHYTKDGYGPWAKLYDAGFESPTDILVPTIYEMLVVKYEGKKHKNDL